MRPDGELVIGKQVVTLSNCDREPIHIPGAIQPHGFLVTVDAEDQRIYQVSRNLDTLLRVEPNRLVGQPISRMVGQETLTAIRGLDDESVDRLFVPAARIRTTEATVKCGLSLHRSEGLVVLEFEPSVAAATETPDGVTTSTDSALDGSVEQLFERAASEVRQLTGYDRVMVYRFDGDGHGEVIGEALDDSLDPLVGHHYPATDIPRQARVLYLRQMIRMIVDVDYEPSPVLPADNPLTGRPLDLGLASLRSVSPIHLQYLRNMGVTGTLTISLIDDGELWGMIACHHYSGPRFVPHQTRSACRFIGELLSAQLRSAEATEYMREHHALALARGEILQTIRGCQSTAAGLRDTAEAVAELIDADGVTILTHAERLTWGAVPAPSPEAQIAGHVSPRRPLVIDRLSRDLPAVAQHTELSGVLALPLPEDLGTYIIWYRDDWARELRWGGDPNATLRPDLTSMDVKSLSPRRSFETFRQSVVGQSRPWRRAQIDAAVALIEELATIE